MLIVMNKINEKLIRRLKIIEGQVRGLQDMILKDEYCIDIITQTSAVKQALSGVEDVLMENHLGTCVIHQIQKGKEKTAIEEILKVYQLKRK
jgi:DNA-binding FrmR family transcriptional regulator